MAASAEAVEDSDACFARCDTLVTPQAAARCADGGEQAVGPVEQFVCEQGFSVGFSMGCTHLCLEQVVQQRGGAALRATLPAPDSKVQGAARDAVCRSSSAGGAGAEEADTRACSLGFARGVLEFLQGQDGFAADGLAVDRWLADSAQIDSY